jgi:hypothetical protein
MLFIKGKDGFNIKLLKENVIKDYKIIIQHLEDKI